jgi:uncharacterized protein (TIGR02145 family)
MKNLSVLACILFTTLIISSCGDILDSEKDKRIDVKRNDGVIIGNQIWMIKNLDVTHYRNGDPIPEVKDSALWANLKTGAWCYYNNDHSMGAIYGKLYNWYAVNDSRGLAPLGWHIPSDSEWFILTTYLGGDGIAGGKMKEVGTYHWSSPNTGATNESGFNALPGGLRYYSGAFYNIGTNCNWWSSTESSSSLALDRILGYEVASIHRYEHYKENGFAIRCIKD